MDAEIESPIFRAGQIWRDSEGNTREIICLTSEDGREELPFVSMEVGIPQKNFYVVWQNPKGKHHGPIRGANWLRWMKGASLEQATIEEAKVLDHGYVKLIETWGDDSRIIEAARMSSGKGFLGWGNEENPGDEKLLRYLWMNRHTSPFEQCGMTIEVQAPIMVFREWMRHRVQSFNEMSARYIQMPDIHYVPDLYRAKLGSKTNKQAQGTAELAEDADLKTWLSDLQQLQAMIYRHYEAGLALGIPKEVARLNTPVSRYSRMRASANLLNWLRFLGLRLPSNAQWEIRRYAQVVRSILASKFPRTLALFQEKQL